MNIVVSNYVDLISRYALFGRNGYYIYSFIIKKMLVDELGLGMSYNDIESFIKTSTVTLEEHG